MSAGMARSARLAAALVAGFALLLAFGLALPKCEGSGAHPFTRPAAAVSSTCPAGMTCLSNVDIADHNGLGDALTVHDYLGNPMMGVDTFQLYSSNPVCSIASSTNPKVNLQPRACLGGAPPLNATGGYPVLALWDGRRWQTLTAGDIAFINGMRAAGITVAKLVLLLRKAGIR